MSGITCIELNRYRVDFAALGQSRLRRVMNKFLESGPVMIDPFRIGQAVRGVMRLSSERDVHGRLLAWNEYKIYLSRSDYDRLRPLQDRLSSGLDTIIRKELQALKAETVGDPVVRILVDEETDLPRGIGEIMTAYLREVRSAPTAKGEMTIRVNRTVEGVATHRVGDGSMSTGSTIRLKWLDHSAVISPGQKRLVGRPHEEAPANHIALVGASNRINSCQLTVENTGSGLVVTRLAQANPIQVDDRVVQPGGKRAIAQLPVQLSLSNGELIITVESVVST